ncbi:MAG: hypothetical protein WCL22_04740, partial [bacterium]
MPIWRVPAEGLRSGTAIAPAAAPAQVVNRYPITPTPPTAVIVVVPNSVQSNTSGRNNGVPATQRDAGPILGQDPQTPIVSRYPLAPGTITRTARINQTSRYGPGLQLPPGATLVTVTGIQRPGAGPGTRLVSATQLDFSLYRPIPAPIPPVRMNGLLFGVGWLPLAPMPGPPSSFRPSTPLVWENVDPTYTGEGFPWAVYPDAFRPTPPTQPDAETFVAIITDVPPVVDVYPLSMGTDVLSRPIVQQPDALAYVPSSTRWDLAPLAFYPDTVAGKLPLPTSDLTEFAYVPAVNRWGIDDFSWLVQQPDPTRARCIQQPDALSYVPSSTRWDLAPLAFYPD